MFRRVPKILRRIMRTGAERDAGSIPGIPFMDCNPAYAAYRIGKGTYGNPDVFSWGEGATLNIGRYCSIAAGVKIFLGGEHRLDWVTTYPFSVIAESAKHIVGHPHTKGDVNIQNDVWIGFGATILSGVTLSNGSVVGAGAVVSKDVPPYSIVAGNPARIVRTRFPEASVVELEQIAWWNWPDDQVERATPYLLSGDIQRFIDFARSQPR